MLNYFLWIKAREFSVKSYCKRYSVIKNKLKKVFPRYDTGNYFWGLPVNYFLKRASLLFMKYDREFKAFPDFFPEPNQKSVYRFFKFSEGVNYFAYFIKLSSDSEKS